LPQRFCCPECFDDRWLRNSRFPALEPHQGTCSFCGTVDVPLVEPKLLATDFELLANVYEPSPDGKTLVEWMKEDWKLFPDEKLDLAHAKELLGEIFDNGDIVRRPFIPSPSYSSEGLIHWETLRDEMMFKNRWFLEQEIDRERMRGLLTLLLEENVPKTWYRARLQTGDNPFSIEQMNAPPKHLASHGRANPAGIPYLYLGSLPETAVAEIRPHTGEVACIANFEIPEIRAVDLRHPRQFVSPFLLEDAEQIGLLRADLPFLERLGDELTRPVLPQRAAIDYIPSQYLCEFIKTVGIDGVLYRSSVSDGINLALFNPPIAHGGTVSVYKVTKVSVEVDRA
jgi:RES domain